MDTSSDRAATPVHLWIIAAVAVLWNGFGVYDYLMSKLQGDPYFRQMGMTDAQIAYVNGFPMWVNAVWAIGVWGGLLGAILLLLRKRAAAPIFMISLAAFLLSLLYTYVLTNGIEVMEGAAGMQAVILAGCIFFAWYARAMARKGVLA